MISKDFKVFIFLFFAIVNVEAQFKIDGQVVDSIDQSGISNADVYIENSGELFKTNSEGKFIIESLKDGIYILTIFHPGYKVKKVEIQLESDLVLQLNITPLSGDLEEVVISEERDNTFSISRLDPIEGTSIYAGKKSEVIELDNFVGNAAANNARQIYSQVVGLNIYEGNDAGLQLNIGGRGLDPSRSSNFNTRQNGYDISADVLGYPESYYTPPAEALQQIRIIRGAASLQYGTQFGGLINFQLHKPNETKKAELITRNTFGSFGLYTNFTSLSGKVNKFSYYTYLNYKQGNGFRPNSEFNSINYFGLLKYELSDNTSVTFEYTYLSYLAQQAGGLTDSQFNSDIRFSNRERNWFAVNWNLFSLKLDQKLSYRTTLSLNLFGLLADRKALGFRGDPLRPTRNPITEADDPSFNRDLIVGEFNNWGAEIKSVTRYRLANKNAVFLIGSKYYQSNNFSEQGPGGIGNDANFNFRYSDFPSYPNQSRFRFPNFNLALFGENIFYLNDKLSVTPGFRFEHIKTESVGEYLVINFDRAGNEIFRNELSDNRTFERNIFLLGTGLSYYQSKNLEVYANVSQNYRSVTFSDIRVVNPTFIIDPDIRDERGFTTDFGIRGIWEKYISYDLGGFALLYNDRIGTILVQDGPNKGDRVRKNVGDALIYGFESFLDWNLLASFGRNTKDFRVSPFVNLSITSSEYLKSQDNNIVGKKVEFIPLVNLKTGIRLNYRSFGLSSQFTYLSEQYTDAENTEIAEPGDSREGIIGTIPSYFIADLSLSYTWKIVRFETGINNLTNEAYFTRRTTGYPGPGIIPADPRTCYLTIQIKL